MKLDKHLINLTSSIRGALTRLDELASDAILFVVDENNKLVGSLTDGDIRRGLISGKSIDDGINDCIQHNPKYFKYGKFDLEQMQLWRERNYRIIPVLNEENIVIDIINFRLQKSFLPIDAVVVAGGEGKRLRPLTLETPKPLLKVGDKPIIEYNIDRLKTFGIINITLTVKYLGNQLIEYFGDGKSRDLSINYIEEKEPLGTIGALGFIKNVDNDYILVMNSDLLTNINYEDMFQKMMEHDADMIVATTPYEVQIPYGVVEVEGDNIVALIEKPTYTYYSNAGIYIFKEEFRNKIPLGQHFNATDLMELLYSTGKKVISYPILDYWLDIGKPRDFEKAQRDIKSIKF